MQRLGPLLTVVSCLVLMALFVVPASLSWN